jgi:hypothetical protein
VGSTPTQDLRSWPTQSEGLSRNFAPWIACIQLCSVDRFTLFVFMGLYERGGYVWYGSFKVGAAYLSERARPVLCQEEVDASYHCHSRRTAVAVAGEDYCIVAASTRLSTGYSILTRDSSKVLKL